MPSPDYRLLTAVQLRTICRARGISTTGLLKADLVAVLGEGVRGGYDFAAAANRASVAAKASVSKLSVAAHQLATRAQGTAAVATHTIVQQIQGLSTNLKNTVSKLATTAKTLPSLASVGGVRGGSVATSTNSLSTALQTTKSLYTAAVNFHKQATKLYNDNKESIDQLTAAAHGVAGMLGVKTDSSKTLGHALAAAGDHLDNVGGAINSISDLHDSLKQVAGPAAALAKQAQVFSAGAKPFVNQIQTAARGIAAVSA
jgi:hypothetical protein